ncbi:MAG: pyridoxal-phosphate dependent enzyme [Vicinamibacteria bacterium]|nr:pyridoxal-phosphate dependent enzyme [Vicinamibacteria bacterium]
MTTAPRLACAGCGALGEGALPFRCPNSNGDGRDHVLARVAPDPDARFSDGDPNPFLRYRSLSYSWAAAQSFGLADADYVALVRGLDAAVAEAGGRGFTITPWGAAPAMANVLGLADRGAWVKDETNNVSGSHKARHLFGLALCLAVAERAGRTDGDGAARPLAIASCGNAALAAAVVARAARRELRVFVPVWAEASVIARLTELGASIETCERRETDPPGDPCHHRFREVVRAGALPFSVQGSDNALTIDGGMTLAFELAEQSFEGPLDRLFIQAGGGALASSVIQGLTWARALGRLNRLPAIHAVQTAGGFPLIRAWRRVARALLSELGSPLLPANDLADDLEASRADASAARWLTAKANSEAIDRAIHAAAADRARFMWPWESEPKSAASGILDDETYDWLAVVRGMLATGGWPVVASEANVLEAHCEGRGAGIQASATGTAGLAGAMTLAQAGLLDRGDRVGLLFTGVER